MQLTTMPQFDKAALKYFSPSEILTLEDRLKENVECGKAVTGTKGRMRRVRHPNTMLPSERGFIPVVVYLINDAENEVILVDVIDGVEEFKAMLRDPVTWLKAISLGRFVEKLKELLENLG